MIENFKESVLAILENELNLDIEIQKITNNTLLGEEGLNIDSIALIELSFHFEEEFGVVIPDEDIDKMATFSLADLETYIQELTINK